VILGHVDSKGGPAAFYRSNVIVFATMQR